jgi:hypothetical protein
VSGDSGFCLGWGAGGWDFKVYFGATDRSLSNLR